MFCVSNALTSPLSFNLFSKAYCQTHGKEAQAFSLYQSLKLSSNRKINSSIKSGAILKI